MSITACGSRTRHNSSLISLHSAVLPEPGTPVTNNTGTGEATPRDCPPGAPSVDIALGAGVRGEDERVAAARVVVPDVRETVGVEVADEHPVRRPVETRRAERPTHE